jgi:hypothetical protein
VVLLWQKGRRRQLPSPFSMALLQKNGDLCLFWWFCCEEGDNSNVVAFFYGGWVVKKAMGANGFFFFRPHGLVH